MSVFTLVIPCLTTSTLPWFLNLTYQVPMQYCWLQHQTLLVSPVTSTTGYCVWFGSIPSVFLKIFLHWSPVAYWALTDLAVPLSVSSHFAFSYCSCGSQGKNTKVVCHFLLQWTTFCQPSPSCPGRLGWPLMAWPRFSELNKAVVHVIRLASCLWLWSQCVCPLMPSRNTNSLSWVSISLVMGYLLTAAPAKRSHCSLPWTRGNSSGPPLLTLNLE